MQLTVRLFALQRQQLGVRQLTIDVADGATIAEAWSALCAAHPLLAAAGPSMRFARNAVYAEPTDPLTEGDELALIPPVAGGAPDEPTALDAPDEPTAPRPPRVRWIALSPEPIRDADVAELRAAVSTEADGAIVTFLGVTRESSGTPAPGQEAEAERFAGQRVVGLDYEAYESMALVVLEAIADEISSRFDVQRLAILHRVGAVGVGETSVAIAVAAAHRGAAFDACRYAIEELKARAPIWKSERFADGSVWLGAPARNGPPAAPPDRSTPSDPSAPLGPASTRGPASTGKGSA